MKKNIRMDFSEINSMEEVFNALHAPFIEYLNHDAILKKSKIIKSSEAEIFSANIIDRNSAVEELLNWISKTSGAISNFLKALKELHADLAGVKAAFTDAQVPGPDGNDVPVYSYLRSIISLIDGSLVKQLSIDILHSALDKLKVEKCIDDDGYNECKMIKDPTECSSNMYKLIKKRKCDWVFVFINEIFERSPDLQKTFFIVDSQSNDCSVEDSSKPLKTNPEEPRISTCCDPMNVISHSGSGCGVNVLTHEAKPAVDAKLEKNDGPLLGDTSQCSLSQGEDHSQSMQSLQAISTPNDIYEKLSLWDYQNELTEKAVQGLNTVICAPTGSGKTRVAIFILLKKLEALKEKEKEKEEEKENGQEKKKKKRKKIAFLTRTIPLTIQQCNAIKEYLPAEYKISHVTGQTEESSQIGLMLEEFDVIVMTPMILENSLKKNSVKFSDFSLLVFDECHHTRKNEPYNILMYFYFMYKFKGNEKQKANLPQIVGLSATIEINKAGKVPVAVDNILEIFANLDAPHLSIVNKHIKQLKKHVPEPIEKDIALYERKMDDCLKDITDIMGKMEEYVIKHINDLTDNGIGKIPPEKKSQAYNLWAVNLKKIAKCVPIEDISMETNLSVRAMIRITDYLIGYNVGLEAYDLVELKHVMSYLSKRFKKFKNEEQQTSDEQIFYSYFEDLNKLISTRPEKYNPNLKELEKVLLQEIAEKGDDLKGIIFVRTRALAEVLQIWLSKCGIKSLQDLKAQVFTGSNASEQKGGMSLKQQENTIRLFRDGYVKVLVATSVAEEGLDIPDCNLVIKYNYVGNEISSVQTKGRARLKGGVSYILATELLIEKAKLNRRRTEMMNDALKVINKMSVDEVQRRFPKYQEKITEEKYIEMQLKNKPKLLKEEDFTMVCSLCRKVSIKSTNIRIMLDKFRVSIDRDLKNYIMCKRGQPEYSVNDYQLLGPVFCRGEPVNGKVCGNELGTMIKTGQETYFAIGISEFSFYKNCKEKMDCYKKWDQVPYVIKNISYGDRKIYNDVKEIDWEFLVDDSSSDEEDEVASANANANAPEGSKSVEQETKMNVVAEENNLSSPQATPNDLSQPLLVGVQLTIAEDTVALSELPESADVHTNTISNNTYENCMEQLAMAPSLKPSLISLSISDHSELSSARYSNVSSEEAYN